LVWIMKYKTETARIAADGRLANINQADVVLYDVIADWVEIGSTVLDIGCGSGELLQKLTMLKKVRAQGIEIDENAIYSCVAKGLSVLHEDINGGLKDYSDKSFDYVILYNTFQEVKKPSEVLDEALRVGKNVIAGFPNFAYYRSRFQIFFLGKVPITPSLPYQWFDTPNLHFLSIKDFEDYCRIKNIAIHKKTFADAKRKKTVRYFPNFFAEQALYLISR